MDGWVDDSFRKYCHFVAPSCKLELARFSALPRIQDGAECGNNAKAQHSTDIIPSKLIAELQHSARLK